MEERAKYNSTAISQVTGFVTDDVAGDQVKAQKELFDALKESELRYRRLVESLSVAVYTTDAEGYIMLYNKAAADLWGRDPDVGKDLWCGSYKIYNPDGSPMALDLCPMAQALREKKPVMGKEIIVMRPDGSFRTVAPHPQPLFDESGKMTGAVNMLVDITGLKRTELAIRQSEQELRQLTASLEEKVLQRTQDLSIRNEELRRSEERYHKMIDEVEDYAIILLDPDGIIQNWNKGAEKIKGYREEEIVGKEFSVFYRPEDREAGLPQKLIGIARENGKAIHEGWRVRKNGTRFWGSIVLTALHDEQGNIIGFSKVTRDLTERKLAEDRLKQYNDELQFQNKELEQFAYAASHDMKEPLRKVHFYNSFLVETASEKLDEKSKDYLGRSINAVKRMTELIDNLLTYSRTTSSEDKFEAVDLNAMVEEIILVHKDELEQKNIMIASDRLPVIQAIAFQFKQLLSNLIDNSIKYQHPGRNAVISIKHKPVRDHEIQDIGADPDRQYHRISVEDNGIGFEQQYAEKIFEIFQRLNTPGTKGSGIGLAICRKIVQNHRGFITAVGKVNEGARFDIYIPF